jgi:hypothetical protein
VTPDQRLERERREDEPEGKDRPQIGDEASSEHGLAIVGRVEPKLQHHRIHHGHRGGREGHTGEPARGDVPIQHRVGDDGAADEGREEAHEPHRGGFFPPHAQHRRVELRTAEKGEQDRPASRQEFYPGQIGLEHGRPERNTEDKLREGADRDLGERGGNTQPNREQRGDQSQA